MKETWMPRTLALSTSFRNHIIIKTSLLPATDDA